MNNLFIYERFMEKGTGFVGSISYKAQKIAPALSKDQPGRMKYWTRSFKKGTDWKISSTKRTVWVPVDNRKSTRTQKTTPTPQMRHKGSEIVHSLTPNNQCALAWQHQTSFWGTAHKSHAVNKNNFALSTQVPSPYKSERFPFDRLLQIILWEDILQWQSFPELLFTDCSSAASVARLQSQLRRTILFIWSSLAQNLYLCAMCLCT